jgi:hypothetical protein
LRPKADLTAEHRRLEALRREASGGKEWLLAVQLLRLIRLLQEELNQMVDLLKLLRNDLKQLLDVLLLEVLGLQQLLHGSLQRLKLLWQVGPTEWARQAALTQLLAEGLLTRQTAQACAPPRLPPGQLLHRVTNRCSDSL